MRIVKIGAVTLDHAMWWDEYDQSSGVMSEVVKNLDGGVIVFEQAKRISIQNVTLMSRSDGWQKKTTMDALIALANGSLGLTFTVEDDDGGTFDVRFRHEQNGGAVQFERVVGAKLSEWYTGTIYLAKV